MGSADKTYKLFIEEFSSLEKSVYALLQKNIDYKDELEKLKEENLKLRKENEVLRETLSQFEGKRINGASTKIKAEDKENLKNQIDELISKIDFHLKS